MASSALTSDLVAMVKDLPRTSGASRAADAVDIVLGVDRHVEVDDVADVRNVEAARRDIGRDEQLSAGLR